VARLVLEKVERGLIRVLEPRSEEEEETFVNLALQLDDGEAMTGALAIHRGAAVATDDKKAIRILEGWSPPVKIRRTSQLVKEWSEARSIPGRDVRRLLRRIGKERDQTTRNVFDSLPVVLDHVEEIVGILGSRGEGPAHRRSSRRFPESLR